MKSVEKMKKVLCLVPVIVSLLGCLDSSNDSNDNEQPKEYDGISIENGRLKINPSLSYVQDGKSFLRKSVRTTYYDKLDSISSKISVDLQSTVTTGARIEADISLHYQDRNITTDIRHKFVVMRIRDHGDGAGPSIQAFMGVCLDDACSSEAYVEPVNDGSAGTLVNYSMINDWSAESNISVSFDSSNNEFVFGYGNQTLSMPVSIYNNNPDVVAGGMQFDVANFKYAELRASVKSIDSSGESGSIDAYFDDVLVDGVLYDDFSSDSISTGKWVVKE